MNSLFTPDYSHLTGLLNHLNDEELKGLLESEEKVKALVSDLKQVHDIETEREILLTSNKSISEYNLSKKPTLEEQRKQVEETRHIAISLKDSLIEKKRKIELHQPTTSKETILALLQAATLEKEEEAEAAVEQFLQNELSIEDFLLKYLEVRKLAHLRRIKSEKLANTLLNQGVCISSPPYPQKKPTSMPNALPYPTSEDNIMKPARPAPQPPGNSNHPSMPYPYPGYSQPVYRPTPFAYPSSMPSYPHAMSTANRYPYYK